MIYVKVQHAVEFDSLASCDLKDLSAWEPFWVPARASSGEWLGIDLDAGADWQPASWPNWEVVS